MSTARQKRTQGNQDMNRNGGHQSGSSLTALDTKVEIMESDLGDLNTRITSLDTKFDNVMTSFASEFRNAIGNLSTQLSEKNKTPWGVLISGMGVILTVVTLLGHQTLSPIAETIASIQRDVRDLVPRKEADFRHEMNDKRIGKLEIEIADAHRREYDRLKEQLDLIQKENYLLKYPNK